MPLNAQIDIEAASEIVTLNGTARPWVDIETARSQSRVANNRGSRYCS